MITKNTIKYVHSLGVKKYRDAESCFVAEGPKVVGDLLSLIPCKKLFVTSDFIRNKGNRLPVLKSDVEVVTPEELNRLSLLRSPREVLGIFQIQAYEDSLNLLKEYCRKNLCLALDGVQDPGNLGTIIRIADWFGIEHIVASRDTVDVYSPKVVQATMGAIGRVHLHYLDLVQFLSSIPIEIPVFGTFLNGKDIYHEQVENRGIIVMGNEGNGISDSIAKFINHRLLVCNYPLGRKTSESLNVAVTTAIVCAEFRRRAME